MSRPVGIDLGTTYTVVATIEDRRPRVLPNAEGQHLTPSVVALLDEGGPLVGQAAKLQAAANPGRTVFSIKRRMGSNYTVRANGREYSPQEVSALILSKVKADAEKYLGEPIHQAVVTVPAYFNDRQRQATKEAAALAGLDVMRMINEPTAAALAYGLEREDVHTVLVWDLGGGTFDVSVLELGEGIFEVRAVSGDTWLGGDDFDHRVMDYLAQEYRRVSWADFPDDAGARQKLREVAEKAKIELSASSSALVRLPVPHTAVRCLEMCLSRVQLERLTADLLQRMAAATKQALDDAELTPADVDRVILVGGATRMPAIRRLARELMGKEPYRYIDPDEVVAMGAAIQAGVILRLVDKVVLLDVLPLTLGVETQGGLMAGIIPRNTPLPASGACVFTTAADYQTSMDIHILQGERPLVADNISLGRVELSGIAPAPRGGSKVEVAFDVDADGIMHLSATDLLSGNAVKAEVASTKLLDPGEIKHLAAEAQRSMAQDKEKRERAEASVEAESVMAAARMALDELWEVEAVAQAEQIEQAVSRIKEAVASGVFPDVKARSGELRQLLMAIHKETQGDSIGRAERRPAHAGLVSSA
ncbi:MAG: molecular chaperone DnaK [Chloroflexota bacterium]